MALKEVILEDKSIYMVFEYAEHDFLVCPLHSVSDPLYEDMTASNTSPLSNTARAYQ